MRVQAVALHREPHAQGAEDAGKLQAAVAEIDVLRSPLGVLQVLGEHPEGRLQPGHVAHHQTTGLVRLKEPLVRVQTDAVAQLQPRQQRLGIRVQYREAAVGRVDVIPESLVGRDAREFGQGVDGPGVGGARVGDQTERREPVLPVARHGVAESRRHDPEVVVHGQVADQGRADPGQAGGADGRRVCLRGNVDGARARVARRFPRGDERNQVGGGTAAGKHASGGAGIPQPFAEPVRNGDLDLGRARGLQPRALEYVEPADQKAGEYRGPGGAGRDEGEEARMVDPPGQGHDIAQHRLEDRIKRTALFRRRSVKKGRGDFAGGPLPGGSVPEIGPAVDNRVDHAVPGAPHLLGILQQ